MLWLVLCLAAGLFIGLRWRPSPLVLRWLDRSLVLSLVVMLVGLGTQVGRNPQLAQALDRHALTVVSLLICAALASILWGLWLEGGRCR